MATHIMFSLGGDDEWLRQRIRGFPAEIPRPVQEVIVEDSQADYTAAALATLKSVRRLPYGGCLSRKYRG